nr:capping protein inhibiting regulator of actin dynamics-like [Lytechinus pictus]
MNGWDILFLLAGERGYGSKVEWQGEGDEDEIDTSELDLDLENVGHPIGCAVFVFSAEHTNEENTNGLTQVVDVLHKHQGRYPVAVITHVDVTEKDNVQTLKTVLRVCGISDIFEVANLTDEKAKLEEEYQLSLLSFIERCMTDGDETLVFKYYQQKEERRRQEIKKKKEEKEQEEEERRKEREREESELAQKAEEDRRNAERNRFDLDYEKLKQEQEHRFQMEKERSRAAALERDLKDLERREREREDRYEQAIRQAEKSRQDELRRIMEANRKEESSCSIS